MALDSSGLQGDDLEDSTPNLVDLFHGLDEIDDPFLDESEADDDTEDNSELITPDDVNDSDLLPASGVSIEVDESDEDHEDSASDAPLQSLSESISDPQNLAGDIILDSQQTLTEQLTETLSGRNSIRLLCPVGQSLLNLLP